MQKNITRLSGVGLGGALTLAAALSLPEPARADSANVNVYGQANVSYDMINTGTTTGIGSLPGISSSRVSSNSSRLGLKGSSDLGSGWSVPWQVEATAGTDTGASGGITAGTNSRSTRLFDRDTYLGLSHEDWGRLQVGRQDTPYKIATRRLDVFADGIADNRSLLGTTVLGGTGGVVTESFDVRMSNQVAYFSPSLDGYSIAIGFANLAEGNTNTSQPSLSALSVAGMYEEAGVYLAFAYEAHATTLKNDPPTKVKAAKLGWGYNMGILDLGFAFEKTSDEGNANLYNAISNPCGGLSTGTNCSGHKTLYFSAKINLTSVDALKLAFTRAGQVAGADIDTGANQFSMGLEHGINERTRVYILYTSLKNDKLARYGLSSAASSGLNSVNPTGTGGAFPSAFSFGMKHSF